MPRLTITLSDEIHQALKETAARQGRTMAALIEESLRFRGYRTRESASELVRRARKNAEMDENDVMPLAVQETREARQK